MGAYYPDSTVFTLTVFLYCHAVVYSGTPVLWTPWACEVSCINSFSIVNTWGPGKVSYREVNLYIYNKA